MATPLPQLSTLCTTISTGPGELAIHFPGGAVLTAQYGVDTGDSLEIVRSLLGQVNAGLAPLGPFFDILDAFKAVMDCITAIPDTLGPPPDPTKLNQCLPGLVKAISKLLQLLPQLSVPRLVKEILVTIAAALSGIRTKLAALINQQTRIAAAALRGSQLGNIHLQAVVGCAASNLDAQLVNMNNGMAPINRLIGLVNVLLKLAKLPCIPTLGNITEVSDAALKALDVTIELLGKLIALIPTANIPLPPIPLPHDPC